MTPQTQTTEYQDVLNPATAGSNFGLDVLDPGSRPPSRLARCIVKAARSPRLRYGRVATHGIGAKRTIPISAEDYPEDYLVARTSIREHS